jgi:predicted N-acetyltransferase YhbS
VIKIAIETEIHQPARERLLNACFGERHLTCTSARLRQGRLPADGLSLVALDGSTLVGTLRFWHIRAGEAHRALLLGPLAVTPDRRNAGIGSKLMQAGLSRAYDLGHTAVLLVGDEPYYRRFGFSKDWTRELTMPGPYDRERLLGLELFHGGLTGAGGMVIPTGARAPTAPVRGSGIADWTRRSLRRGAA